MRLLSFCLAFLATCSIAVTRGAVVIKSYGPFDVYFYGSGDTGGYEVTGAQDWTDEQMGDVEAAVTAWDQRIADTPGRRIAMHLYWENLDPGVLGGSSSPSNGSGGTSWNYGEHVWRDEVNYSGPYSTYDTLIRYDPDVVTWNFGADDPGTSYDFRSVVTHEIGHSLGFSATYYPAPFDDWGHIWGTSGDEKQPTYAGVGGLSMWDQHLIDDSGNEPSSGGTGTPENFNEVDNPVYWTGEIAEEMYGSAVPIYAPTTYSGGSSLSHLDESEVSYALMGHSIGPGDVLRAPSELEWAMMEDMGWTIVAVVPEPSSLVLLLAGSCIVLLRQRRR